MTVVHQDTSWLVLLHLLLCATGVPLVSGCGGEEQGKPVSTPWDTVAALESETSSERDVLIKKIDQSPDQYAPPVFYAVSRVLIQEGKQEKAAFWFYAGQLRARFDANRCTDATARQAVGVLNLKYGLPINQYMFQDKQKLRKLIPQVVQWDRKTPHNYDHRWINPHGMDAVMEELEGGGKKNSETSAPRDQWDRIAEETRVKYLEGFERAMSPTGQGHPREYFEDPQIVSLVVAVETGNVAEIDGLVSRGVDLNAGGTNGITPLEWAFKARQKNSFKALLEKGADPNQQNEQGVSAVSLAARVKDDSEWLAMVLKHEADPNLVNPTDDILAGHRTPIFDAILSYNKKNLELLINAGADLDFQDDLGETPMIYAAGFNSFDTVYFLLEAGADFEIKDNYGRDLAYEVVDTTVHPESDLGRWRLRVYAFLEHQGVDFDEVRRRVDERRRR